jgi:sulfoxide reductase heme-binding subunit YedZ
VSGTTTTLGDAIWLAARSAGLVAYGLVGATTLLGLLQSTRSFSPKQRMALRPLHEALAVMSLLAVVLHAVLILADPWLRPGLAGILIPFASPYRPLAVALGVVGFYLSLLIGPTYYLRQRLGAKRWRAVHAFAPATYALVTLHVILAGSDASTVWLRFMVGAMTAPILVLVGLRLFDVRQASSASRPSSKASTPKPSSEPSTTSASNV